MAPIRRGRNSQKHQTQTTEQTTIKSELTNETKQKEEIIESKPKKIRTKTLKSVQVSLIPMPQNQKEIDILEKDLTKILKQYKLITSIDKETPMRSKSILEHRIKEIEKVLNKAKENQKIKDEQFKIQIENAIQKIEVQMRDDVLKLEFKLKYNLNKKLLLDNHGEDLSIESILKKLNIDYEIEDDEETEEEKGAGPDPEPRPINPQDLENLKKLINNDNIMYKYIFYNSYIFLSNTQIYSIHLKDFLSCYITEKGYIRTSLSYSNKHRNVHIHTLVGENFLINDDLEHKTMVDHKNRVRTDNRIENLHWVTPKINAKNKIQSKNNFKPVVRYTLDGKFVDEYPSLIEAAKATGWNYKTILNCCRGYTKTSKNKDGKFIWKYKNPIKIIEIPEDAKLIPGYTIYYATKNGHIYSTYLKNFLSSGHEHQEDVYQELCLNGNSVSIHRIIMEVFCENLPKNWRTLEVNHKNGKKNNNSFDNLEFGTHKHNELHKIYGLNQGYNKHVNKLDAETNEIIETFPSIIIAARVMGVNVSSISGRCNGKIKNSLLNGYKYEFASEEPITT